MASLLLAIIYLAFITLGLPDSLLGAAWPSMYQEIGASVSWAGILSMITAAGTIISSLASDRIIRKLGAGRVTAISSCMTAVALFGFSTSRSFWILCLWAVPYGLGAGSIDAALNNFVALHYPARHMSWLHCMWGIGASAGAVIIGWAIAEGFHWNGGYQVTSILQFVLTITLFLSLPLWKRVAGSYAEREPKQQKSAVYKLSQIIKRKGVKEVLIFFFCYCALESTAGMWAASYCTIYRGITPEQAARWASLFYLGITAGRFVCGFLTMKINDKNMIRLGQGLTAVGLLLVRLLLDKSFLFTGLILIGCGCAPIYPSIIHETPVNFGKDLSQSIIGVQMAAAYVGTCLIPPIFGLLAQFVAISMYPFFLVILLVIMVVMSEKLHILTTKR